MHERFWLHGPTANFELLQGDEVQLKLAEGTMRMLSWMKLPLATWQMDAVQNFQWVGSLNSTVGPRRMPFSIRIAELDRSGKSRGVSEVDVDRGCKDGDSTGNKESHDENAFVSGLMSTRLPSSSRNWASERAWPTSDAISGGSNLLCMNLRHRTILPKAMYTPHEDDFPGDIGQGAFQGHT